MHTIIAQIAKAIGPVSIRTLVSASLVVSFLVAAIGLTLATPRDAIVGTYEVAPDTAPSRIRQLQVRADGTFTVHTIGCPAIHGRWKSWSGQCRDVFPSGVLDPNPEGNAWPFPMPPGPQPGQNQTEADLRMSPVRTYHATDMLPGYVIWIADTKTMSSARLDIWLPASRTRVVELLWRQESWLEKLLKQGRANWIPFLTIL